MGSEKSDLKILKMVIWEKELHEQSSRKERMNVVFHNEDMKPETTEKNEKPPSFGSEESDLKMVTTLQIYKQNSQKEHGFCGE